ncbi:MAG TPA: apolipoprotein N-acyltransferase [Elusimicrobiales bacterium]|nr:apolipoprotein N-acyltransferase [Elusimicrobiales bacterium]
MEPSAQTRRERAIIFSLAALSGLLLASLFAPVYAWPLGWAALLPLFWAVLASRDARQAALLGAVTGLIFYPLSLCWMVNVVNAAAIIFWAMFAAWLALHAALIRGLWGRLEKNGCAGALAWTAAAGITWAGIEYFRSEIWALPCPWLGLGYSQAGNAALYQTLSLWGVYGLSALLAAVSAALALASKRIKTPAVIMLCALLAAAMWGRHRLASFTPETGRQLKVALVQAERAPLAVLIKHSLAPAALTADLLLWPELSFLLPGDGDDGYLGLLRKQLKPSKAVAALGTGINTRREGKLRRENFILFMDGAKKNLGRYDKMHPVPFVEYGLPSYSKAATVDSALGRLGPQICYDLAFEDGTRKVTEQGAELLVSPTLDYLEWGNLQHTQHSDMSGARAVEAGLWLVRAASSGRSQIIDPLGRERASLANGLEGVLTGEAYLLDGGTFYSRRGWLFAPAALALTALAAALLLACARRRTGPEEK